MRISKRSLRRALRSERGTSIVEFAILAPVLIFLVIGVIEIGRYMYFGIVAAHMAESGARYGAQSLGTAADVTGMRIRGHRGRLGPRLDRLADKVVLPGGQRGWVPASNPRAGHNLLRKGRSDSDL